MRRTLMLAGLSVWLPIVASAVELRDDLPFIDGRYATPTDCKFLQEFEAKGEERSLNNAAWHLTSKGFTDGWEQSCEFHAVFIRDKSATAQTICVAGAETWIKNYLFELQDSPPQHPDIYVFEGMDAPDADREGTQYSWCPSGAKPTE